MQQKFVSEHKVDGNNNPAGGTSSATGLMVRWQDGPLRKDGVESEPNGAFVETLIAVAKDRLDFYQESKFSSQYNAEAISFLNQAIASLNKRTADRVNRGVEGTHAE